MKKQLEKLKELGVTTLLVANNEATAVNPYNKDAFKWAKLQMRNLPPLPTSGIPDGPVGIDEVEEERQWLTLNEKWISPKAIILIAACEEWKYPERIALVPKALTQNV